MFILKKLRYDELVARTAVEPFAVGLMAQQLPRQAAQTLVAPLLRWRTGQPLVEPFVARAVAQAWVAETHHVRHGASPEHFLQQMITWLDALLDALPATTAHTTSWTFTVPLWSRLTELPEVVQTLVEDVLATTTETPGQWGGHLGQTVIENMCRIARLSEHDARARPHRLLWPKDSPLTGSELIEAYLGNTLLGALLTVPVTLSVTDPQRLEHTLVLAGSGHGKTQTLQHLIVTDAMRPENDRVGMIVIDSQGDMIATLSRVRALADRIVLIDAADVEHPPALNLFDLGGFNDPSPRAQQSAIGGILQLYEYIIGGLFGAELTNKQATTFRFLIRLMLDCPGATIHTLREVLEDPAPFAHVIARQSPTAQQFFAREFSDRHFAETRRQLLRRLYGVLQNPVFEKMFGSARNGLDLNGALRDGRIVLINTAREVLQDEARVFGRYCIALALKAAFDRARLPQSARRTAFLYIDEASDYMDETVTLLLAQARKYKLGVVLAHQALEQLPEGLRALVMANTGIKLAGGTSARDARALADDMQTEAAVILGQKKHTDRTNFALFVRGLTSTATPWTVPFLTAERQPCWTDQEFDQRRQGWRLPISTPIPPRRVETPLPVKPPRDWDDFSEPI